MIPKIIHYCWFSDKPGYPDDLQKFLDSWKKHLPDYEIKLWNADNFDINQSNDYVKEAMAEGKYAFVSDFVRLWALYNYGGIYLDGDVEVFKSFDPLLDSPGFMGFESDKSVASCLIASDVNNPLLKELMTAYNDRHFVTEDGRLDLTPNPFPITKCLIKHGLKINNRHQKLDNMVVYPQAFFCPDNDMFSEDTYAVHHYNGSWQKVKNKREQEWADKEAWYIKWFGKKTGSMLCKNINILRKSGIGGWIRHRYNKIFNEHE